MYNIDDVVDFVRLHGMYFHLSQNKFFRNNKGNHHFPYIHIGLKELDHTREDMYLEFKVKTNRY